MHLRFTVKIFDDILVWLENLLGGNSMTAPGSATGPATPVAESDVLMAIQGAIVEPLGLPASAAYMLLAQSSLETGAWKSSAFRATKSLFNRHKGKGAVGQPNSDGYWTGKIYYAGPNDPDLRVYSSIDESAQDFAQWLSEGVFVSVLSALRDGSMSELSAALDQVGFSTQGGYGSDVARVYADNYASRA